MTSKTLPTLALIAVALAGTAYSACADTIVNIDFLAQREGEATASANYVGQGAAGGGATFNGLDASDTDNNDNITVSGSDLLDSNGGGTSEGFSISPVGSDNETGHSGNAVNEGYVFINSAGNSETSVDFTISGLGDETSADLYFYTTNNNNLPGEENAGTVTLSSGTQETYTADVTGFDSTNTIEFDNVTVADGTISGTYNVILGPDETTPYPAILSGLSIETAGTPSVPEPSSLALMVLGGGLLVWHLRHRRATR